MEVKRELYLNKLIERKENGLVKVITGIRRCGKSYLLFHLYRDYLLSQGIKEYQIISISLDEEENIAFRDPKKLFEYLKAHILNDSETFYVLLDEAQLAITEEELKGKEPIGLYGILNGLIRRGNVDVYVTGSNSKFLSSDIMTEFRGRGDEVRVYPLSFAEFMSAYQGDRYSGYAQYTMYGGLPMILFKGSDDAKIAYLNDLLKNTYIRDVIERHKLRGDIVMETLVDILASDVGSLTNPTKLVKTFGSHSIKTNENTVSAYIDHLIDAFLVCKANRYDIKGKKYIGSPFKYYFCDVGLRNARLNFRQVEPTHLMENIIYNELVVRGFNVDVGIVEQLVRNKTGNKSLVRFEVDFVCNKGSKRYYIQSAYSMPDSEKMDREQTPLNKIDDSFKKIIVVNDNILPWHNEKGYLIINVTDFLLDPNSLDE